MDITKKHISKIPINTRETRYNYSNVQYERKNEVQTPKGNVKPGHQERRLRVSQCELKSKQEDKRNSKREIRKHSGKSLREANTLSGVPRLHDGAGGMSNALPMLAPI